MISRRVLLSGLLTASLPSAVKSQRSMKAPPALGDGWQVADLASAGLDRNAISELVEMIDAGVTTPNIHAVLIEHMGRLVFEQYWTGEDGELGPVEHGPETLHDIRSISKSVTSLLLGIVLDSDAGDALARPITSFFPNRNGLNAELGAVTLHQVLTMTAGLAWNESIVPYNARNDYIRLIYSRDPIGFVLEKELRNDPGDIWNYNSGLTDLVAAIIESISGRPLITYADEVLFGPLGITEYEWWRPPAWPLDSFPSASAGLRMRARDLAKIASITMNGGKWLDSQIVPEAWIERSTARQVDNSWGQFGYGYFWYRGRLLSGNQAIRASGYGDQEIFVLPDDGLAITIFAGNYDDPNWAVGERIAGRVVRARG